MEPGLPFQPGIEVRANGQLDLELEALTPVSVAGSFIFHVTCGFPQSFIC